MERAHLHDKHKSALARGEKGAGSRWEVWWTEPHSGTGRTVTRRKRFAKKIHADRFVTGLNAKFAEGVKAPSADGKKIFRDVAADWQASRLDVRRSHLDRADRELRLWVLPVFGHREVGSITKDEVQKFAASLRTGTAIGNYASGSAVARKPFAPATVRSIVGQVRGVLEYAVENNLMVTANPVSKIKTGKVEKTKMNFLTFEQVERLRNLVGALPQGAQHALLVEVMAFGGLRIGEALLLRREDVNVVKRRIAVSRSWTTEGTRWVPGSTKTGKSRAVPISASLAADLEEHVASVEPGGYLFCGPRGVAPWQPDNWRARVWKKATTGTEFEVMNLTPHDLRHTAASMAIAAGAEVMVVQAMLGHASATETLNTYAHLWPDRLDTITAAVEAARRAALGLAS